MSNGSFSVAWRAADAGTRGPPVVGGGAVWVLGIKTRILYALDPNTGATMASVFVGSLQHFVTPTLTGGEVLVPTASGVVAFVGA